MRDLVFYFCWMAALGVLGSCEAMDREAYGLSLPSGGERIALQAYLGQEDSLVSVRVTASQPAMGVWVRVADSAGIPETRYPLLPDANVQLRDVSTGQVATLRPHIKLHRFICPKDHLPLVPGHTYELTAEAPGYPIARARATMPTREDLLFKASQPDGPMGYTHVEIHAPREPLRYFLVWGTVQINPWLVSTPYTNLVSTASSQDGILRAKLFERVNTLGTYEGQVQGDGPWNPLRLYELNADLYHYLVSAKEQYHVRGVDKVLSPPVAVHSNVQNGFGVLGFMTLQATSIVAR